MFLQTKTKASQSYACGNNYIYSAQYVCLTAHKDGIYKQCPLQFSCTTAKSLDSGQS